MKIPGTEKEIPFNRSKVIFKALGATVATFGLVFVSMILVVLMIWLTTHHLTIAGIVYIVMVFSLILLANYGKYKNREQEEILEQDRIVQRISDSW